jgi:integrase
MEQLTPTGRNLGTQLGHNPSKARSEAQKFHKALERLVKSPPKATEELADPSFPGLFVRIGARGKPTWTYRYRFQGQLHRESLGNTLADAHSKVEAAQRRLKAGEAPFPREEAPAEERIVETVAALFFKQHSAQLRTGDEQQRLIERNFLDRYGKRPIASITRRDIRDALARIRDRAQGKASERVLKAAAEKVFQAAEAEERERAKAQEREPDLKKARAAAKDKAKAARLAAKDAAQKAFDEAGPSANRTMTALHKFFGWAVEQDFIVVNPVTGLKPIVKETPRDRVLSDDEIRAIWKACDAIGSAMSDATKMLFLTGRRLREVTAMRWEEVDGSEWRLPAARTKNQRDAITPLSPTALAIIKERPKFDGSAFVFTSYGKSEVKGYSKFKAEADRRIQIPAWKLHDIRRTVATNLQRLGVRLEVTESVLGHVSGSRAGVVGIYQRYDWAEEKRVALSRWADRLADIVAGRASNVVTLAATG